MESRTSDRRRYVQRVLIAVGIVTAMALAVWVLASAAQGVFVIFAGILLSVFFVELAQRVARWTGLSYRWAVGITIGVLVVVGGGTLFLIGTRIAERADELVVQYARPGRPSSPARREHALCRGGPVPQELPTASQKFASRRECRMVAVAVPDSWSDSGATSDVSPQPICPLARS